MGPVPPHLGLWNVAFNSVGLDLSTPELEQRENAWDKNVSYNFLDHFQNAFTLHSFNTKSRLTTSWLSFHGEPSLAASQQLVKLSQPQTSMCSRIPMKQWGIMLLQWSLLLWVPLRAAFQRIATAICCWSMMPLDPLMWAEMCCSWNSPLGMSYTWRLPERHCTESFNPFLLFA